MNGVLGIISTSIFIISVVCMSLFWLILLITHGVNSDLAALPVEAIVLLKTLGVMMGVTLIPAAMTITAILDV